MHEKKEQTKEEINKPCSSSSKKEKKKKKKEQKEKMVDMSSNVNNNVSSTHIENSSSGSNSSSEKEENMDFNWNIDENESSQNLEFEQQQQHQQSPIYFDQQNSIPEVSNNIEINCSQPQVMSEELNANVEKKPSKNQDVKMGASISFENVSKSILPRYRKHCNAVKDYLVGNPKLAKKLEKIDNINEILISGLSRKKSRPLKSEKRFYKLLQGHPIIYLFNPNKIAHNLGEDLKKYYKL